MNRKRLYTVMGFWLIFAVLFAITCRILTFRYDDGILQMEQFYDQPRGSVDLLVLGSSHAFVDIDPAQIKEQTGLSTYDLGASMQSMWHTYYDLEEALKYQHPKLIILDVFRMTETFDYSKESKLIKSVYGMRPSMTKLRAIRAGYSESAKNAGLETDSGGADALGTDAVLSEDQENAADEDSRETFGKVLMHFCEFPVYHSRYPELTAQDLSFWEKPPADYRGHYSLDEVNPQERPDLSKVTEKTPVEEKTKTYFLKILERAKEENIPVLLVNVPYVMSEEDKMIYNSMEDLIAQQNADGNVRYLDLNTRYDEIGIDFETDFADAEHLNENGARKLNRYLADYINENYR